MKVKGSRDSAREKENYNTLLEYSIKVSLKKMLGMAMGNYHILFRVLSINGKVIYSGDW